MKRRKLLVFLFFLGCSPLCQLSAQQASVSPNGSGGNTDLFNPASQTKNQTPEKIKGLRAFGVTVETGSIFIQSVSVRNVRKSHPLLYSFELSRLKVDSASYRLCRAYLRRGNSFSYVDFNTPILGHGLYASVFMEPIYRISKRFQFQFRGDFGISYLSNPFDSVKNPSNQNYSLHITPYIHISAGFGYRLTNHFTMEVNGNMHHFSNGNYKQPNAGINLALLSLSLNYFPESNELPKYHTRISRSWVGARPSLDLGWMFVPSQPYVPKSKAKRHYLAGMYSQLTKQVSPVDAITVEVEAYYNDFTNGPGVPSDNDKPSLLTGLLLGHEFLMGKVIFSQQLGFYLTGHPTFYTNLYHRWGLRYKLSRRWYVGFNLKAHGKAADFIDLRTQLRF